jgi:UDP-N-acetylglucosamine 4-epimerase
MKILVTGAAGFIGSNLCEYFVGKGYDVLGLDNLATGHMSNIDPLYEKENFSFIKGDIRDIDTCHKAINESAITCH